MPVQLKMFAGQPMMSGCCTRKFCGIVCRLGVLCFSSLAFKIVVVKTWDGSLRLNTELCYKFIVVAIFYISLCSNSLFCMFVHGSWLSSHTTTLRSGSLRLNTELCCQGLECIISIEVRLFDPILKYFLMLIFGWARCGAGSADSRSTRLNGIQQNQCCSYGILYLVIHV